MGEAELRGAYLVGKRVALRPLEEADAEICHAWLNDPDVRRTLAVRARPVTAADSRDYIRSGRARGDQLFAVVTRADGLYVGNAGLEAIDAVNRRTELGLVIGRKEFWGRGYGAEAAALCCRHAFDTLNLHKVSLSCYATNERGLRLYTRLGFQVEGRRRDHVYIEGRWVDEIAMGLVRGELAALT